MTPQQESAAYVLQTFTHVTLPELLNIMDLPRVEQVQISGDLWKKLLANPKGVVKYTVPGAGVVSSYQGCCILQEPARAREAQLPMPDGTVLAWLVAEHRWDTDPSLS